MGKRNIYTHNEGFAYLLLDDITNIKDITCFSYHSELRLLHNDDTLSIFSEKNNAYFKPMFSSKIKSISDMFVPEENRILCKCYSYINQDYEIEYSFNPERFENQYCKIVNRDIVQMSATVDNGLALKKDETVWSSKHGIVRSISDVTKVASGNEHYLALKIDGTVWTWGNNIYGQLGNRTRTSAEIPMQITEISDVKDISAGENHSVALKNDGSIWIWGSSYVNRHSDNNGWNRNSDILAPEQVLLKDN